MSRPKLQKYIVLFKNCNSCGEEKEASQYNKQSSTRDGLSTYCIECLYKHKKEKYHSDPKYREKVIKNGLKWYENNKEKSSAYKKERLKSPWNRIPHNLSKKLYKKTKYPSKVGIKMPEFKTYIESLFESDMTWENYGDRWYIGNIIPIKDFDLNNPAEVIKINYYTNLKPVYTPSFLKIKSKDNNI